MAPASSRLVPSRAAEDGLGLQRLVDGGAGALAVLHQQLAEARRHPAPAPRAGLPLRVEQARRASRSVKPTRSTASCAHGLAGRQRGLDDPGGRRVAEPGRQRRGQAHRPLGVEAGPRRVGAEAAGAAAVEGRHRGGQDL